MISSETMEAELVAYDTAMSETSNQKSSEHQQHAGAAAADDSREAELEDGEIEEGDPMAVLADSAAAGSALGKDRRAKRQRGGGSGAIVTTAAAGERTSSSTSPSDDESDDRKKRRKRHKHKKRKEPRDGGKEPRKKKRRVHDGAGGDAGNADAGWPTLSRPAALGEDGQARPLSRSGGDLAPPGPYDSPPPGPYDSPPDSPRARDGFVRCSSPSTGFFGEADEDDNDYGAAASGPGGSGSSRTLLSLVGGDGLIDPSVAAHEKQDIFSRSREPLSPGAGRQRKLAKRKVRGGSGHPGAGAPKSRGPPLLGPGGKIKSERPRCKFFMEGKCSKGDDCSFSHNFVPPRKLEACRFFLQGYCSKGEACLYLHNDIPCKFFHTGQRCRLDTCRFSHSQLTDDLRPVLQKAVDSVVEEQPPEPKKRPSLLGSPPQHIKDAAERMIEQQQKAIPSLFDIRVEPTAALACRLGERSGDSPSPPQPRSQLSPSGSGGGSVSSSSLRASATDGSEAVAASGQPRSKPGGFYTDALRSPPRPPTGPVAQPLRPPRPALLPTPVMYAESPPRATLLPPLLIQQPHAMQPSVSDPSESGEEEDDEKSEQAPLRLPYDAAGATPAALSAGLVASALPLHLPKAQRDLLLRLQKQQSQRVPDLSEVQQSPPDEAYCYSSDEEPEDRQAAAAARAAPTATGGGGSSLHGSASGAGLASALPGSNILADILNSIKLPQRGSLAPAALGDPSSAASSAQQQPQSNTLAQMLMAIRSTQPASSLSAAAAASSETVQSASTGLGLSSSSSLGSSSSGLSLFSGPGSLLNLSGLHNATAAGITSATLGAGLVQSSASLSSQSSTTTPEYRLIPVTVVKLRPWLPPGARTDPELQKDPRVRRLLEAVSKVSESPMSPEQSSEPVPATTAAASSSVGAATAHATLPDIWLPPINQKILLEKLPGLNVAALAAAIAKPLTAPAAETRGSWPSPNHGPGDGGGATREHLTTVASSLSDPRLAAVSATPPETRSLQQQPLLPTDPRQRLSDPRVRPNDPRTGKPAIESAALQQKPSLQQPASRTLLIDPRTGDPRLVSLGNGPTAMAAATGVPLLGDPRVPADLRVLADSRMSTDPRLPSDELAIVSDPRLFAGSDALRSDQRVSLLHDPRASYSNGMALGRGGSASTLRPIAPLPHYEPQHYEPQHYEPQHYEPQHYEPQHYEPQHYELHDSKSRRGGLVTATRVPRPPDVLRRPPPGVGLLPTPLTPPLADSRSADSVVESVAMAPLVEPDLQQQQASLATAVEPSVSVEQELSRPHVAQAQLRGEGDSRKIGMRKSSMEYSSPLGGDGDSDRLDQGFNSYNKPRNLTRTSINRAAATDPTSSSSSNGGARGGGTADVQRLVGGDPTPDEIADVPAYQMVSLKEKFKAFDPTASPFS